MMMVSVVAKVVMCMWLMLVCYQHLVSADSQYGQFTLGIRDSIMIAHSFTGKEFGPAQNMHGATYTVDVDFIRNELEDRCNWVIDIGEASTMLSEVLAAFNFQNLNELFPEDNTTTEFMCREIHRRMVGKLHQKQFSGKLRVKLFESHKAWASYTEDL